MSFCQRRLSFDQSEFTFDLSQFAFAQGEITFDRSQFTFNQGEFTFDRGTLTFDQGKLALARGKSFYFKRAFKTGPVSAAFQGVYQVDLKIFAADRAIENNKVRLYHKNRYF